MNRLIAIQGWKIRVHFTIVLGNVETVSIDIVTEINQKVNR